MVNERGANDSAKAAPVSRLILFVSFAALLAAAAACSDSELAPPEETGFTEDRFLITLSGGSPLGPEVVSLFDLSNSKVVAEAPGGYQTWALYRESANELLVSTVGGEPFTGHLTVYDVADTSSPVWTIVMADRSQSTILAPAWALSEDERYLYYASRPSTQQYAQLIKVIDLDLRGEIARARLSTNCDGYKILAPSGQSDARVLCASAKVVTVSPAGAVSTIETLPLPQEAMSSIVNAKFRGCSGIGLTFPCVLGEHRRLMAYSLRSSHSLGGLVIYKTDEPSDYRIYQLRSGFIHFAPVGLTHAALLEAETSDIYLLDFATGRTELAFQAPPETHWMFAP